MSDLDEIRQKRMAELQAQQAAMQNQAQQQAMAQAQQIGRASCRERV